MGDRGNIYVVDVPAQNPDADRYQGVYLYTHWGGSYLNQYLAEALGRGQDRWGDSAYLARIIFCQMLGRTSELSETTGFGITTINACDNEHLILRVMDGYNGPNEVHVMEPGTEQSKTATPIKQFTYAEFVKAVQAGELEPSEESYR